MMCQSMGAGDMVIKLIIGAGRMGKEMGCEMICKFCDTLDSMKKADKFWDEHDMENGCDPLMHEYSVVIMRKGWIKGQKDRAGVIMEYGPRRKGFVLAFCPECGRKLKKVSK